jgi:hypothetical protein
MRWEQELDPGQNIEDTSLMAFHTGWWWIQDTLPNYEPELAHPPKPRRPVVDGDDVEVRTTKIAFVRE